MSIHGHGITLLSGAFTDHLSALGLDGLVEKLLDLLAPVDSDSKHTLQAADLHSTLAVENGNTVGFTQGSHCNESGACGNVVGHWDTSIDERECRSVQEGSEEGTVGGKNVEGERDARVGEEMGVSDRSKRLCDYKLKLLGYSLIIASSLLVVHRGEASHDDTDIDGGVFTSASGGLPPSLSLLLLLGLRGTGQDAHDFGVAHLEVGRAIGSGLDADLGVQATELVPATAIDAQERK
ncbi:unnamed protein product [Clonostachys rhizophaga]|uniref:Uncharacterized protein n=1 Tax=Clonostachys rhizophaga TaxID=160324 RepID=A0A9N9VPY2_9HYPO|nr:unnamed protein product [Clonostachys rhizophaga]